MSNNINVYVDVKSLSTSLLTWQSYAGMVQLAIKNGINNFIFSNDDIDYKFYAESRFKTAISNAKINLGISGKTIEFIKDRIDIHYAINPKFAIQLDKLLNSIEQQSITSAYVFWDENYIDESIESIKTVSLLKNKNVLSKIGVATNNKNLSNVLHKIESICKIDYIVINDIEYPDEKLTQGKKVLFSSTVNRDIFLLVNLLFKDIPLLKSKLNRNSHLKELLKQFLDNYSIDAEIANAKSANLQGIILHSDNAELLEYLLINSENATNSVSKELTEELRIIKNGGREPWW